MTSDTGQPAPLDLLKALGDNTRYAIYLELARSPVPRSTAEVAESLGLHVNTVRPQMERMREVGLLEVAPEHRGAPGRPQHRYSLAPDAPSLGLEPPTFPMLARMLVGVAARVGAGGDDALAAGRDQGAAEAAGLGDLDGPACIDAVVGLLARMGFDPEPVDDRDEATTVAFARCPFRELAEANPDLVCGLHRGLIEGFVGVAGSAQVVDFGSLVDRHPCRVQLAGPNPGSIVLVITLTETAAGKVRDLIDAEGEEGLALRVAVRPGGCSGFSYEMFFDTDIADDDVAAEYGDGVRVVVDPSSAQLLEGATLDYKDGLNQAGFSINNPNAQRTCGCGQSFS